MSGVFVGDVFVVSREGLMIVHSGGGHSMADNVLGDFFLSDGEDTATQPVAAPVSAAVPTPAMVDQSVIMEQPSMAQMPAAAPVVQPSTRVEVGPSREERLANTLNKLMEDSQEIEASALVSLDGFTMASALPAGMQEDRVGAMSAAILGLGERAAIELGRGQLSQVFIEGDGGYVMLIAAGDRAVLTCMAGTDAKLGLVLYDMRVAAEEIAEILG